MQGMDGGLLSDIPVVVRFIGHNRRMPRSLRERTARNTELPAWIKPQRCQLVKEAPSGDNWAHELKFDGYRMHARIDRAEVRLLTRTGLDWTDKYPTKGPRHQNWRGRNL